MSKLLTGVLLGTTLLGVGGGMILSGQLGNQKEFLRGKLTACIEFTTPMRNQTGAPLLCQIENNDVVVVIEGTPIKFKIDGTRIN